MPELIIGNTTVNVLRRIGTLMRGPSIVGIEPAFGPSTGGTQVTIFGFDFFDVRSVRVGDILVSDFFVEPYGRKIIIITPPQFSQPKKVAITINASGRTNEISGLAAFTYIDLCPSVPLPCPTPTPKCLTWKEPEQPYCPPPCPPVPPEPEHCCPPPPPPCQEPEPTCCQDNHVEKKKKKHCRPVYEESDCDECATVPVRDPATLRPCISSVTAQPAAAVTTNIFGRNFLGATLVVFGTQDLLPAAVGTAGFAVLSDQVISVTFTAPAAGSLNPLEVRVISPYGVSNPGHYLY